MNYGLPYKGSKNKLAERIVRLLPKRTNLVDLFCGGCAVTHAAMVMGKYKHIHVNDINWMCPTLFIDAINGKYNNESRWISREDFFRLKDTDPYVSVVWSFGNNMRDYLYSREIEPLKKAIHYAMFFSDYSLAKELGHDLSFIDPIKDLQKRYMAVRHYFNKFGHFQLESFLRLEKRVVQIAFNGKTNVPQSCTLEELRKRRLRRYSPVGVYSVPITSSVLDYQDVEIPKNSVIYCYIPYEGTNVYNKAENFDYERFYDWCECQSEPVFISSYQMPKDRFDCIKEFAHHSSLCATAKGQVTERIFVPKHQSERGNKMMQLSLF